MNLEDLCAETQHVPHLDTMRCACGLKRFIKLSDMSPEVQQRVWDELWQDIKDV